MGNFLLSIKSKFIISEVPQSEMELAILELNRARNMFDNADDSTLSLAIYELMAAEEKINMLIKEKKREKDPN